MEQRYTTSSRLSNGRKTTPCWTDRYGIPEKARVLPLLAKIKRDIELSSLKLADLTRSVT
ncbi:hypothetical protein SCA6_015859 [Theobroma cacao]